MKCIRLLLAGKWQGWTNRFFHPLCFKSSACLGHYTHPLLLFAELDHISLPLYLKSVASPMHIHSAAHSQWSLGLPSNCPLLPLHESYVSLSYYKEKSSRGPEKHPRGVELKGIWGMLSHQRREQAVRPLGEMPTCPNPSPEPFGGWEQTAVPAMLLPLGHFLRNNWELWSRYVSENLLLFSLGAFVGAKKSRALRAAEPRCLWLSLCPEVR